MSVSGGWVYEPWRDNFYPPGLPKTAGARVPSRRVTAIEINATYYRHAKRGELREVARCDARRLRLRRQGEPLRHQPQGPRRGRRVDRTVRRERPGRARTEARPAGLAVRDDQGLRRCRFRRIPRASAAPHRRAAARHAMEVRHPSFMSADYLALARKHGVATVFADSDDYPSFADPTADFIYARLMKSESSFETGYAPERIATWADRVRGRGRRARSPRACRASRQAHQWRRRRAETCSCSSSAVRRSVRRRLLSQPWPLSACRRLWLEYDRANCDDPKAKAPLAEASGAFTHR